MKRYNILSAALAAALMLTSCGGSKDSGSESEPAASKKTAPAVTAETEPPVTLELDSGAEPINKPAEKVEREPIAEAYRSGDSSALSDKQLQVLKAAEKLLNRTVTEDMSPVEKELAIHDRLLIELRYDDGNLNVFGDHFPHAADIYGGLIEHSVICSGYAETFALMMDMVGIESTVVYGQNRKGNDHAWDLVKLDGEWYAVDPTWDDLDDDLVLNHEYFNITDEVSYDLGHRWEKRDYPASTGRKYSYSVLCAQEAASYEETVTIVRSNFDRRIYEASVKASGEPAEFLRQAMNVISMERIELAADIGLLSIGIGDMREDIYEGESYFYIELK